MLPGREQTVGADDHQYHGYKEQDKCAERIRGGEGDKIPSAQTDGADNGQQRFGFGLLFAGLSPLEQLDGMGQMDLTEAIEINEDKNSRKKEQGTLDRRKGQFKSQGDFTIEKIEKQQEHQLVQQ